MNKIVLLMVTMMVTLTVANSIAASAVAQAPPTGDITSMLKAEQPQAAGNVTAGAAGQVPEVYAVVCPPGWTDPQQCDVIRIL
jgi:hypothetical protein